MTALIDVKGLSQRLEEKFPASVVGVGSDFIILNYSALLDVAKYCHDEPDLAMDMLVSVTGVDYIDYFEVVYHLVSVQHNHKVVLKTRTYDRDNPEVPSVISVWRGADLQEREVYDLMGIRFNGHPNLKRVMLWEGFPGHPHRKDFTSG